VDGWLSNLRMVVRLHEEELSALRDPEERAQRLVELNVVEQVQNLGRTPVVQAAWADGRELRLHGWVYRLDEGRLRDIGATMTGAPAVRPAGVADVQPRRAGAAEQVARLG